MEKEAPVTVDLPQSPTPIESEVVDQESVETRAKRKRAAASIDYSKISRKEEEPEETEDTEDEPPSKKAKVDENSKFKSFGDSSLEQHLNLVQAQQVLLRCKLWFPEIYAQVCGDRDPLEYDDETEANKHVASIKLIQSNKSSLKVNEWLGSIGLGMIEDTLVSFTPVKAQGLGRLGQDPDFQDLWKEISLDMLNIMYVDPKVRMGAYLAKNIYMLHHLNCMKEEQESAKRLAAAPVQTVVKTSEATVPVPVVAPRSKVSPKDAATLLKESLMPKPPNPKAVGVDKDKEKEKVQS